jgi:predicted transcriptional regulator
MISLPKKRVEYYMSSPVICIDSSATFADAFRVFSEANIHGAPVTENGKIQGIVTLTDIADGIANGRPLSNCITDVMTRDVLTAPPSINLYEVIGRFKQENIGRLIIVNEGIPIGILTQSDIIRVFPSL